MSDDKQLTPLEEYEKDTPYREAMARLHKDDLVEIEGVEWLVTRIDRDKREIILTIFVKRDESGDNE